MNSSVFLIMKEYVLGNGLVVDKAVVKAYTTEYAALEESRAMSLADTKGNSYYVVEVEVER